MSIYTIVVGLCLAVLVPNSVFASLPGAYQGWDAEKKLDYMWEKKILPSEWKNLPDLAGGGWGGIISSLRSLVSLGASFSNVSDEMPEGRTKIIHTYGSVGKIEFQASRGNPYTGMFRGADGLVRLSLAGDPKAIGYTPGMALKFFINGRPSVNLHVMQSVNGQGEDQNFFKHKFSNIIPEPKGFVLNFLSLLFMTVKSDPNRLSVDHLAQYDSRGRRVITPSAPEQLIFVPTGEVQISSSSKNDFRSEIRAIPANTVLYEVWAKSQMIGRLILRSQLVPSAYGDHNLFFQHNM